MDYFSIFVGIFTSGATAVLCYQMALIRRHFNEDHRIRRNVYSIDLLDRWTDHLAKESRSARHFVESLGPNECLALAEERAFSFILPMNNEKDKDRRLFIIQQLRACLGNEWANEYQNTETISIGFFESLKIKNYCNSYLNPIETILNACHHGVANYKIISEELSYIIHLNRGYRLLEGFRDKNGGTEAFPAIYRFLHKTRSQSEQGEPLAKG